MEIKLQKELSIFVLRNKLDRFSDQKNNQNISFIADLIEFLKIK
jgi:hypothetical protein